MWLRGIDRRRELFSDGGGWGAGACVAGKVPIIGVIACISNESPSLTFPFRVYGMGPWLLQTAAAGFPAPRQYPARPFWHSMVHRLRHWSFHAGTWCMFMQTTL